jgi:hypothetical protein
MADLMLDCRACGKKFRITYAVKPKQVACPQCKAKVSTAAEGAAGSEPAAAGETVTAAPAANGGAAEGGGRPAAAKPRRLPAVLKSEEAEFQGWTYDREAEAARQGLQKADVMGVLWIGAVLLMIGFIFFSLARRAHWGAVAQYVCGGVLGLGGIGLAVAAYLYWQWKKKPAEGLCIKCKGALAPAYTLPGARECQGGAYVRGATGHVYRWEAGATRKLWEIRKQWHVCAPCKRYYLADKESTDFVGTTPADLEKREALYAEALAAPPAAGAS